MLNVIVALITVPHAALGTILILSKVTLAINACQDIFGNKDKAEANVQPVHRIVLLVSTLQLQDVLNVLLTIS